VKLVTITNGLKEHYRAKGVHAKTVVAHDAVDLDDFDVSISKQEAKARLGLPTDTRIILYIGRLGMWKGVETMLEASEQFKQDSSVQFAIIGGYEHEIAPLKQRYPHVRFLGTLPYKDLPFNQQAADILILPNTGKDVVSVSFTSPLKLFTYMASGVPIVASDLPSIREVVSSESVYLFRPDDPNSLAACIETALNDPEDSQKRARVARELVNGYTWNQRAHTIVNETMNDV
jgi:glycosyltransferase involved in cell wall biosynthesis